MRRGGQVREGGEGGIIGTTSIGQQGSGGTRLTIGLLGGVTARCGDRTVRLRGRKAQALLCYLSLSSPQTDSRERLAGLLWSESNEDLARASLRQTLRELRTALEAAGFDGLESARNDIRLDGTRIDIDLAATLARLAEGGIPPVLLTQARIAESLAAGLDDLDPSFGIWLKVQRQTLHDRLLRLLEPKLASPATAEAVRQAADALLQLDPTHEEACRALMRCHAASGNVAAALRVYNTLWRLLDEDYDAEPSEATQALIVAIKSRAGGEGATPPAPAAGGHAQPATPARHVVLVVGDFDVRGVGADQSHLVQGFRHELIARLVRFREWSVVERPVIVEPPVPGSTDRVDYLIQVTVYPAVPDDNTAGFRLVLTLQDRTSGRFIWSDHRVISLARWFDAQHGIVRRIAVAMNVHLSADRLTRAADRPDIALADFDLWLRGQDLSYRWRPDDERRAEEIFRTLIDRTPNFAPAYASLVQIINTRHLVFPGRRRNATNESEALAFAKAAVQIDPTDSRAHLALAWTYALNRQFELAELTFDMACELNENDPWTLVSSAQGFAFSGNLDRARDLAGTSLAIGLGGSALHWGYQVGIRFAQRDYAGCVEAAERAQDIISNLPGWKTAALALLGRVEDAEEEGRRFLNLNRARWFGEGAASDREIAEWFLHCFPIREPELRQRLRDGLDRAGVPVGGDDG